MTDIEKNNIPEQPVDAPVESQMPEAVAEPVVEAAEETTPEPAKRLTKEEILNRLKEIENDVESASRVEIDGLKQAFYKIHVSEAEEAKQQFIANGGAEADFLPTPDPMEEEFKQIMSAIKEKRNQSNAELEKQKEMNLQVKLSIIEELKDLIESPEDPNKNYAEFKRLQQQWNEVTLIPQGKANELWKNYQLHVENFYDLLKLGHELRDYDFRKNLEAKTRLCEQAEALADVQDVIQAFNQLQSLHQEWKETGPVAKDLRDEIWDRFKAASTVINKRHQAHFEALKAVEEKNLADKTALCEELEGIHVDELKTFADWDAVTKKIIDLQARWKTIGYAPQKMNTQIFERFRQGCDAFFEQKAQFFRELKESLAVNLARKKELVEQAEALKDSTDWRATGDALVKLQKQWKEIGAVPRKYSETLWKRFVGACDQFFEARQEATAGQREQEKTSLEKKKNIISQLRELAQQEGEDILQQVRQLQQQWNEAGHVPFRDKDKLYKEYREICDKIYDALNVSQAKRRLNNFRAGLAQKIEKEGSNLGNERNRMMHAYEKLRDEIKTYENNLGFLTTSSKKGNAMVDAMKKKVDKLRDELNLLAQKIKAVDEQMSDTE